METMLQDLRYALRVLKRNPGFTFVTVFTLALGIGATTAIFGVVYEVLLRPLPYDKPDQIAQLWEVSDRGHRMNFTDPNFEDIRSQSHSLQGLAEFGSGTESVSGGAEPTRTMVASVSQDFFPLMRVQPVLGRGFLSENHRFGAAPVALVSYEYWRQHLGSATDLSAVKLTILNQAVSVIGVLPAGFRFPDQAEIWIPRELWERLPSRGAHNWQVIGRLRDGIGPEQAHAELLVIARQIKQQFGQDVDMTDVAVVRLQEAMTGNVRAGLLILMGAVGFLLLIACANVANLLLAQASTREKELAIRAAIGAGRGRLARQFLTEALLMSLAGGVMGVLIARWGVIGLVHLAPPELALLEDTSIQLPVLFFAFGVSLIVAVGLGLFSVLRATTGDVQQALVEQGRSQTGSRRSHRVGRAIIAGQLAITLVLLTGAGLLGRSLLHVLSVDPGFRTENIVTMNLALTFAGDATSAFSSSFAAGERARRGRARFLSELLTQLRQIPGVQEVGGAGSLPLTEGLADGTYVMMAPDDQPPRSMEDFEQWFHNTARTGHADYCPASEGYFRALGIPLLRGRLFDDRDTMDAPHVAVISQALAQEKWANEDPIGHTIEFGNMDGDLRPLTIVGVVGDVREDSLEKPSGPIVYVNYRQRPGATYRFNAVMRTAIDPSAVISSARSIVRALDPNVPPVFGTLTEISRLSLKARRFNLMLLGAFAGTALLLAVAGLYGVMAYSVSRRTGELGTRIALGATPANVLRLVLRQGLVTALIGVAIGIGGAFVLTRTLRSFLFGLSPTDPVTFAAVALLLVFVALLACYFPARRASEVDPIEALRYE
jgi:putative ABC transport system permease protein